MQSRTTTLVRSFLFVLIVLGAVALIVYMKRSTDQPLTPEQVTLRDSLQRIATPDTTLSPEDNADSHAPALTPSPDSSPTAPDSLDTSMDVRSPTDAGYEDGYFTGLDDGISGRERFSYDESSQFPTPAQRRNYTEAYRRGYEQGFRDGQGRKKLPNNEP